MVKLKTARLGTVQTVITNNLMFVEVFLLKINYLQGSCALQKDLFRHEHGHVLNTMLSMSSMKRTVKYL